MGRAANHRSIAAAARHAARHGAADGPGRVLLVIGDNVSARAELAAVLRRRFPGAQVAEVDSLAAAQALLAGGLRPELALCDGPAGVPPALRAAATGPGASSLPLRAGQVAALCAAGHRNKTIGAILQISENTVRAHISRLLQHYNVKSRYQLAAIVRHMERERGPGADDMAPIPTPMPDRRDKPPGPREGPR